MMQRAPISDSEVLKLDRTVDAGEGLRVVQISDCHLGEQEGETLVGMDTDSSLDHVLRLIAEQQPAAQLLLATGDLANHGSAAAYRRLQKKLSSLSPPCAWLAGNHDSRQLMVDTVGAAQLPRLVRVGNWAVLLLDSAVPGQVGGALGEEELQRLPALLAAAGGAEHLLLCLHHPPLPVGCDWLDQQQLVDSDALFSLLAGEPRLRAITCGHVHQDFSARDPRLPAVDILAAPSTCVQFAANSADFKLDDCAPGYRWFDLYSDGRFTTGVSRLEAVELAVDFNSSGY